MVHTSNKGFLSVSNEIQASPFMAQVIVLVIINAMIGNDWKTGIVDES